MQRRDFLKIGSFTIFLGSVRFSFANEEEFLPVMIFDSKRCIDCKACMAACQLEKNLPYDLLFFKMENKEIGTFPKAKLITQKTNFCVECFTKPCEKACNYDAINVKNHVVLINEDKCNIECAKNEKSCLKACPFDAIVFDEKAKKCDMCFDRIKRGDIPRCVSVCPSGALIYGNLKNPTGPLKELLDNNPTVRIALMHHLATFLDKTPVYKNSFEFYEIKKPLGERIVNTVCLECNARCGLRVSVVGDKCVQVDGNPYHPYNRSYKEISYDTHVEDSFKYSANTCAKPQMNNEYVFNPYRITKPLKRAGERGSGKFEPIEWNELIKEIAYGGKIFKHLGDKTYYPGIRDILSDEYIDEKNKEFGSKRNQFVWFTGRSQGGRVNFIKRWVYNSIGSKNYMAHTDICGIGFRMGNYAFTDGKEVELKADFMNSKYMLIFGANIYSALQPGVNTSGGIIARRIANKELKIVLVDPKAPKAVKVAHKWIPITPTKDGALAMGMIQIMLKNGWYNKEFLKIASKKEAKRKNRLTYSNAAHLVIVDENHKNYGKFLRGNDIGLNSNDFVVYEKGYVLAEDSSNPSLEYEGIVKGIKVKTAFKLMKNSVFEKSLEYYSKECGVSVEDMKDLAKEFWQNAPYSAAFAYHGGGNYVGGLYASYAIAMLNAIVGNVNRKGGYLGKGKGAADWKKGEYDLVNFPGMKKPSGVKISREKAKYEKTTEFKQKGYPSKLPWYEFTKGGLSVAAIEGIDAQYPYPIKILFTYFSDFIYSMPGGYRFKETLKDKKKVPLYVSLDTTINETNIYADYIIPDVTFLEGQYGFLTPHAPGGHFTAVRTPVINKLTKDGVDVEKFLIDLSLELNLPGFGDKVIKNNKNEYLPLKREEDYYLRGIANLALNANVKKADYKTLEYVENNYLISKHKNILSSSEWEKVATVLAKGGVFRNDSWFDESGNYKFGFEKVHIWNERLATSKNTITGKNNFGTIKYEEINLAQKGFYITSYKSALQTQSRTICLDKARFYDPDIYLKVNPLDANELGLSDGDKVEIINANGKALKTKVKITNFVTRGCVAYSHHFGHWEHGANPLYIKNAKEVMLGNVTKGDIVMADKKRAIGISPNLITFLSGEYQYPLVDEVSGIPDFSSTKVQIKKI